MPQYSTRRIGGEHCLELQERYKECAQLGISARRYRGIGYERNDLILAKRRLKDPMAARVEREKIEHAEEYRDTIMEILREIRKQIVTYTSWRIGGR